MYHTPRFGRLHLHSHDRNVYTPGFNRHLHSLVINGFYARSLDADDHAFLEQVREHGTTSCGSLADVIPTTVFDHATRMPLLEELEYWESPWEVEEGIARRLGKPRIVENEEKRLAREHAEQIRQGLRKAERAERDADNAAMAAELAHEQEAWEQRQAELALEREQRLRQTMQADREWEAAVYADEDDDKPVRRPLTNDELLGVPKQRHRWLGPRFYEPEWKQYERLSTPLSEIRRYAKERKIAERTARLKRAEEVAAATAEVEAALAAVDAQEAQEAARLAKQAAAAAASAPVPPRRSLLEVMTCAAAAAAARARAAAWRESCPPPRRAWRQTPARCGLFKQFEVLESFDYDIEYIAGRSYPITMVNLDCVMHWARHGVIKFNG
jgi:hypothetical protein